MGGNKGTGSVQKWEGILGSLLSPTPRCLCSPPPRDANAPASPVSHTPPLSTCPPTGDSLESDLSPVSAQWRWRLPREGPRPHCSPATGAWRSAQVASPRQWPRKPPPPHFYISSGVPSPPLLLKLGAELRVSGGRGQRAHCAGGGGGRGRVAGARALRGDAAPAPNSAPRGV